MHKKIIWLTSRAGRNLASTSTAATCLAPAYKMDRVNEPGPDPTSQT